MTNTTGRYQPNVNVITGLLIIIKYAANLNLLIETVYLGIDLYYRTLKRLKLEHNKRNVHLIAFNCILIATKILEDINNVIDIQSIRTAAGNEYTIKELIEMESLIVICHNGKLYTNNIFHKCHCKHDLIAGLNAMCNIFTYPYSNNFESNCWIDPTTHRLGNVCTKPVLCTKETILAEMEMYPTKISQIIEYHIFVKDDMIIGEQACIMLFHEMNNNNNNRR